MKLEKNHTYEPWYEIFHFNKLILFSHLFSYYCINIGLQYTGIVIKKMQLELQKYMYNVYIQ